MSLRPFQQVDVFTHQALRGNPLAVVLDGTGLDEAAMQAFTDWTQLSEATFLLPPTEAGAAAGADYRVRIFCPGRELPFAGHPTLGSCHAWLAAGGKPRAEHVVQECGVGRVRIRREMVDGRAQLAFAAPPLRRAGPLGEAEVERIARGLGPARGDIVDHAWCDNGPQWRGLRLRTAAQVLAVRPDPAALAGLEIGLVAPQPAGSDTDFEVRAFFPGQQGLLEDPVTGSLNAALAPWLIGTGQAADTYVAAQGTALGRAGRVHVRREGQDTWIGGGVVTCISGQVDL